jgi:C4-dicarboxylate-specific signal transduction histidine kinase
MDSVRQKAKPVDPKTPHAESLAGRQFLSALADHHCAAYFIRSLEGFVHNLNGPLQILWMRSEQVRQDIGKLQNTMSKDPAHEITDLVHTMQKRMDSFMKGLDQLNDTLGFLTKDLLGKRQSQVGEVQVNEAAQDTLSLFKADMFYKHRVAVHVELDSELPTIKGRQSDFCVIIWHLVQNALDAMTHTDTKSLQLVTFKDKDQIVIRIEDTGIGVSEEDGFRVFEPFFTTKREIDYNGKTETRMGLGLPIASYLLEEYAGSITFDSTPSKTAFMARIPSQR